MKLVVGDIVAVHTGIAWQCVLSVVVSVNTRMLKTADDGVMTVTWHITALGYRRLSREKYRLHPLDAATRQRLLAEGFSFGPCSRSTLENMERCARLLCDEVMAKAATKRDRRQC